MTPGETLGTLYNIHVGSNKTKQLKGICSPKSDEQGQGRKGGKIVYCERKGNIRVDVRARGRAKRSAPRKAAACAPGGTEGQ